MAPNESLNPRRGASRSPRRQALGDPSGPYSLNCQELMALLAIASWSSSGSRGAHRAASKALRGFGSFGSFTAGELADPVSDVRVRDQLLRFWQLLRQRHHAVHEHLGHVADGDVVLDHEIPHGHLESALDEQSFDRHVVSSDSTISSATFSHGRRCATCLALSSGYT